MKYCYRHDLAFCKDHLDQCGEGCKFEDNPEATFCAVCSGLLRLLETGTINEAGGLNVPKPKEVER